MWLRQVRPGPSKGCCGAYNVTGKVEYALVRSNQLRIEGLLPRDVVFVLSFVLFLFASGQTRSCQGMLWCVSGRVPTRPDTENPATGFRFPPKVRQGQLLTTQVIRFKILFFNIMLECLIAMIDAQNDSIKVWISANMDLIHFKENCDHSFNSIVR